MRLVRIEIAKLYGNLSKRIDFKPRLNLLVGINGSGKTSILNCIDWLLKPDLPRLASTKFELIRIVLEKDGKELSIIATQDATKVTIKEENGILSKHAIIIDLVKSPESIANERDFINVFRHYSMLGPESSERELWKGLNALRAPLAITLDRTISADADDQIYFEDVERGLLQRSKTKSPLDKVLDVTQSAFAAYRDKINRLNESLKLRIVSLAFSNPFEVQRGYIDQDVALDEITRLERKVTSFIRSMDAGSSVTKNISNYFNSAKKLASQARKEKSLRVLFFVQFRHLSELAKAFDDFEKKATNSFEPIGSYLRSINSFF